MEFLELLESKTALSIFFGIKILLILASVYLMVLLRGSLFSRIPFYLFLAAAGLLLHSVGELTLTDPVGGVVYAITAVLSSIFILALFVNIRAALLEMIGPRKHVAEKGKEAA